MKLIEKSFTMTSGIDARCATLLVNKAGEFSADLSLLYKGRTVNLKSIMGLMSLGIGVGAEITVIAEGKDSEEAVEEIDALINGD